MTDDRCRMMGNAWPIRVVAAIDYCYAFKLAGPAYPVPARGDDGASPFAENLDGQHRK